MLRTAYCNFPHVEGSTEFPLIASATKHDGLCVVVAGPVIDTMVRHFGISDPGGSTRIDDEDISFHGQDGYLP